MSARALLKPGDSCIVWEPRYKEPAVHIVKSVGRKWITVQGMPHIRFAVSDGGNDSECFDPRILFAGPEDLVAYMEDTRRREEIRRIVVSKNLHFGIGSLTTEAAEKIVAILESPESYKA